MKCIGCFSNCMKFLSFSKRKIYGIGIYSFLWDGLKHIESLRQGFDKKMVNEEILSKFFWTK